MQNEKEKTPEEHFLESGHRLKGFIISINLKTLRKQGKLVQKQVPENQKPKMENNTAEVKPVEKR